MRLYDYTMTVEKSFVANKTLRLHGAGRRCKTTEEAENR